jgi:hypothetical protein
VKDFSKVVKNKLIRRRSRSPQIGYLPLQSVAEGDPIESRTTAPANAHTQHVHARVETLAQRLADQDKVNAATAAADEAANGSPTTNGHEENNNNAGRGGDTREEHTAIAQMSNSLQRASRQPTAASAKPPLPRRVAGSGGHIAQTPQSPAQIVSQIDHMQKEELDNILAQLETENQLLQQEYDRLRVSCCQTACVTHGRVT